MWGDSHRESQRATLLRYFPDLYNGHWDSTIIWSHSHGGEPRRDCHRHSKRTPRESEEGTASSDIAEEPLEGFNQSEPPVSSIRRALITPRSEMGNTPALCEEAIANGAILPQRLHDTTTPVRFTSIKEAFHLAGCRVRPIGRREERPY